MKSLTKLMLATAATVVFSATGAPVLAEDGQISTDMWMITPSLDIAHNGVSGFSGSTVSGYNGSVVTSSGAELVPAMRTATPPAAMQPSVAEMPSSNSIHDSDY
jgi:hypothetical protein